MLLFNSNVTVSSVDLVGGCQQFVRRYTNLKPRLLNLQVNHMDMHLSPLYTYVTIKPLRVVNDLKFVFNPGLLIRYLWVQCFFFLSARDDWTLFGRVLNHLQASQARSSWYRCHPLLQVHPSQVNGGHLFSFFVFSPSTTGKIKTFKNETIQVLIGLVLRLTGW